MYDVETETLEWRYQDETETFKKRLETVSRPRLQPCCEKCFVAVIAGNFRTECCWYFSITMSMWPIVLKNNFQLQHSGVFSGSLVLWVVKQMSWCCIFILYSLPSSHPSVWFSSFHEDSHQSLQPAFSLHLWKVLALMPPIVVSKYIVFLWRVVSETQKYSLWQVFVSEVSYF